MRETRFKETEIGMIPEDWEVTTIRDFLNLLTDFDANGSFSDMAKNVHTTIGGGYAWFVRATDLEQNSKLDSVRYADEETYRFLKKSSLYGGEVLVAKRGEIGKVYFFEMRTSKATLAPNLYLLKLNDKVFSKWLYYYLKSSVGQELLKGINASTSLGAIYKEDVKNLPVYCFSINEQQAIASALSDVDGLLRELGELIAKKKAIKMGMMQELLTVEAVPGKEGAFRPKRRLEGFEGDWVEKRLGELVPFERGQMLTSSQYIYGPYPVIAGGKCAAGYHYKANRKGKTITISGSGANAGFVGLYSQPIFATDCSTISEGESYDLVFVYYWLLLHQDDIYKLQTGGAQPHIHPKDVSPLLIGYPINIIEQTAIAEVLSDMDAEIAALEAKRAKYEQVKNGMMQELLTGKIRLV